MQPNSNSTNTKQQAGTAPTIKQGDSVQLTGKVEQFNVSDEVDTFSPKSDRETIRSMSASMPVIVVQGNNLRLQS